MKRFTIACDFGDIRAPFHIYVGNPDPYIHPLHFQSRWLTWERGSSIPEEVMVSFKKLQTIALENNVSFEDLTVYALGTANAENKAGPFENENTSEA